MPQETVPVAVVGAGPSGFYAVQALLGGEGTPCRVDIFDRLPSPYGLVRYGVAPDHEKIRGVTKVYARLLADPRVRFFGGVEVGRALTLEDLRRHYDQVLLCTGSQTDRRLGIPGEDLANSRSATEFVAWYNGHPDFRGRAFDLSAPRAAVVGVGNVAIDVARMLVRDPEELAQTDVSDEALVALRASGVREVVVLGRRGPAQAAFSLGELEEMGQLSGVDVRALPEEAALDEATAAALEAEPDARAQAKLRQVQQWTGPCPMPRLRRVTFRFRVSPVEILGDEQGRVRALVLERNDLVRTSQGRLDARGTGRLETLEVGAVFRAVGYRGVPVPGLPFDERSGTIPSEAGRVRGVPGVYVAGWIKRGPTGVIGTNRPCSQETAASMRADWDVPGRPRAADPDPGAVPRLLAARGVEHLTKEEWRRVEDIETRRGLASGRPRAKFAGLRAMREALAGS